MQSLFARWKMRSATRVLHWLQIGLLCSLSACASTRMIDSEVQSFVGAPAALAHARYRFERLPSQDNAQQEKHVSHLEAVAEKVLAKAGLQLDTEHAQFALQLRFQSSVLPSAWRPGGLRPYGVFGWGQLGFRGGLGFAIEPNAYRHTVQLQLRDLGSQSVAYESSAVFEGPWADSLVLFPAILEAALADYPLPPKGARKVVIALPNTPPNTPPNTSPNASSNTSPNALPNVSPSTPEVP